MLADQENIKYILADRSHVHQMELGERILDWKEEAKVGVNNVWKQRSLKSKGSSEMSITIYTSTVNLVTKQ